MQGVRAPDLREALHPSVPCGWFWGAVNTRSQPKQHQAASQPPCQGHGRKLEAGTAPPPQPTNPHVPVVVLFQPAPTWLSAGQPLQPRPLHTVHVALSILLGREGQRRQDARTLACCSPGGCCLDPPALLPGKDLLQLRPCGSILRSSNLPGRQICTGEAMITVQAAFQGGQGQGSPTWLSPHSTPAACLHSWHCPVDALKHTGFPPPNETQSMTDCARVNSSKERRGKKSASLPHPGPLHRGSTWKESGAVLVTLVPVTPMPLDRLAWA